MLDCTFLQFANLLSRAVDGCPPGGWTEFTVYCDNCGEETRVTHMVNTIDQHICPACDFITEVHYRANIEGYDGAQLLPVFWDEVEACNN